MVDEPIVARGDVGAVADSAEIVAFAFRARLVVAGATSDATAAGRGAVKVVAVFADLRVGAGETGMVVADRAALALLRVLSGGSEDEGEDVVGTTAVADSAGIVVFDFPGCPEPKDVVTASAETELPFLPRLRVKRWGAGMGVGTMVADSAAVIAFDFRGRRAKALLASDKTGLPFLPRFAASDGVAIWRADRRDAGGTGMGSALLPESVVAVFAAIRDVAPFARFGAVADSAGTRAAGAAGRAPTSL